MNQIWRSRQATPDDSEAIVELYEKVFGARLPISHWRWQYLDNPAGKMCIFVAEHDGKIVGQCALLPTWINLGGLKIMGGQRVDSMVHPDYRSQGMFSSLAEECYAHAASEGVQLLYHFPDELSQSVSMNRLETHDVGTLPRFIKVLNPRSVIERRVHSAAIGALAEKPAYLFLRMLGGSKKVEPGTAIRITRIDNFDRRFDDLWLSIRERFSVSVWKDSVYLNWRYFSCPDREYTVLAAEKHDDLLGFVVLRCGIEQSWVGHIIDFLSQTGDATAELLLSTGLDFLKSQGMDIATCHVFEHDPFYRFFKNQGFFRYGGYLTLFARSLTPDLSSNTIPDFMQWHLMEGDVDVF